MKKIDYGCAEGFALMLMAAKVEENEAWEKAYKLCENMGLKK